MPDSSSAQTASVELTEASAGKLANVPLGHRLQITLVETRTTGYQWKLEGCPTVLTLESEHASAPAESRPGAPGAHVWLFLAKSAGTCEIHAVSARSWGGSEAGKVLSFPVHVLP